MNRNVVLCGLLIVAAVVCVKATPSNHGVGGEIEADVNDAAIKAAAEFVMHTANTNHCNGLCASLKREGNLRLLEIVSAKTQVVAGTLYKLELLLEDEKKQQVRIRKLKEHVGSNPTLRKSVPRMFSVGRNPCLPGIRIHRMDGRI